MSATQPGTAAGRALLEAAAYGDDKPFIEHILAIEAEAAAAERERIVVLLKDRGYWITARAILDAEPEPQP